MNYSGIKLHLFFLIIFIISACNQEKLKNESIKELQIGYLGKTELKPNAYSVNPIFRDTLERDSNRVGFLKNNLRLHDSFIVSDHDSVRFNLQKDGPFLESNIENAIIESAGFSLENCFSGTIKRPKGRVDSFLNGKLLQTNLRNQEIPVAEYIGNTRYRDNFMYDISYLDKEHGLTASFIWSLEVDQEGALWVGSRKGLLKYDGNYIQKFSQETLSGSINDIFQDSKENFWVASDAALYFFNGKKLSYLSEQEGLVQNEISSITEDENGFIWASSRSSGISIIGNDTIIFISRKDGLSSNSVNCLFRDHLNRIWIGTDFGLNVIDGEKIFTIKTDEGLVNNHVQAITQDKDRSIWIGTRSGLSKLNDTSIVSFSDESGFKGDAVYDLYPSGSKIWIASFNGLISFDGKEFAQYTDEDGLSNRFIYRLHADTDQNIWMGTAGGGLNKFNSNGFVSYSDQNGLSNSLALSGYEDSFNNLWIGTISGISILSNGRMTYLDQSEGLPNNVVQHISLNRDKSLNIGTKNGLALFDGNYLHKYSNQAGLEGNTIWKMEKDRKGNLWIASNLGLRLLRNDTFFIPNDFRFKSLNSLIIDKNERVWCGSSEGLACIVGDTVIYYNEQDGLPAIEIRSLELMDDSILAIGSGRGLSLFNGKEFYHYSLSDNKESNEIWSLKYDKESGLWISTENGIFLLSLSLKGSLEDCSITEFNRSDGLKGMSFFPQSVFTDHNRNIWWGSGKGLARLDLESLRLANEPGKPQLKNIYLNEQVLNSNFLNSKDAEGIEFDSTEAFSSFPKYFSLPHDKNHLKFEFSSLNLSSPDKLQYQYRMAGLDEDWSQAANSTVADYRNMPKGDFDFQVRSLTKHGMLSNEASFKFSVRPPWYETTAYYIGQTIFLGLLLFFAVFLNRSGREGQWVIVFTFITVITLFEFILVIVEPYIDQYSSGIPILKVVVNVMIAVSLNPAERFIRERIGRRKK